MSRTRAGCPTRTTAAALLGVAALAGLLASCAPPPPASLETLEQTARRGVERRERKLGAFAVRAVLRVDGRATGRLPAVSLHARLASPDRVRLQCRWLLGLVADVALRGDTLTAWLPGERMGLQIANLSDTLGLRDPALFLGRALTAVWQAPHDAWRDAAADSAGVSLQWPERDERWRLRLDAEGRPREVSVIRAGHTVTARYGAWHGAGPAAWPARIELSDGEGWVHARIEIADLRPSQRARRAWSALVLPADARRLELDDVKHVLSGRGGSR